MSPSDPRRGRRRNPGTTPPPAASPQPADCAATASGPLRRAGRIPGAAHGVPPPAFVPVRPPRPATPVGGALMVAGGHRRRRLLPALARGPPNESINGFDEGPDDVALGPGLIFLAVVVFGMGITTLAARRILAVAIIGIVAAAFCLAAGAAQLADYSDFADFVGGDIGAGLVVVVVGSLIALAGAIVTTAKRRR